MAFILETRTTQLFDVGALLKTHSKSMVAHEILDSKKYNCVVYYDEKENVIVYQTETGRIGWDLPVEGQFLFLKTKYGLKNDKIFLYLDQPHCFGTNVDVNNPFAVCVVTFSTLVSTKCFYQALLRSRKVFNGISTLSPSTRSKKYPRHQIKIFVSSILKNDQNMLSMLSANDNQELTSKITLFSEFIKLDKKAALKAIFTFAHLNQFRRDRKEKTLVLWQEGFSKVLKSFWYPTYPEGNSMPTWDKIFNLNNAKSTSRVKWIFFRRWYLEV
ncbi:hypothetical protein MDAP_002184 [Mitosporidium daphniae]